MSFHPPTTPQITPPSAVAILAALACGQPGCPCAASVRRGSGPSHCPAPAHGQGQGDRSPSLSVRPGDRAPLFTCHGGCSRPAVAAAVRDRLGGAPPPAWPPGYVPVPPSPGATLALVARLWAGAVPDHPRLAAYLRHRGLSGAVPPALRLHSSLLYAELAQPRRWFAGMVARFTLPDGSVTGLSRTFLDPIGLGQAAVAVPKRFLGRVHGSAIHLGELADGRLAVAEGIETALAVAEARGIPLWAAGSAPGVAALELPDGLVALQVWADPDPAGRGAADQLAARARRRGITVEVFVPHPAAA